MVRRARPPHVLNVRNLSEDTKRRLTIGKARQGVTFAVYFARLERLHQAVEREARRKGTGASLTRALLAEAELRLDPGGD